MNVIFWIIGIIIVENMSNVLDILFGVSMKQAVLRKTIPLLLVWSRSYIMLSAWLSAIVTYLMGALIQGMPIHRHPV